MIWPFVIVFLLSAALLFVRLVKTAGRKPWFRVVVVVYALAVLLVLLAAFILAGARGSH